VNISIPLLNGARFSARAMEADLAEQQAHARIVEQRQLIERDLRKTLANAQAAYQKIAVTEQILEQANLALELATTRYKLGLSNMVELNDAQNAQIAAQIGAANARYSYRIWSAELRFQTGE
jgi:outer membrane protein